MKSYPRCGGRGQPARRDAAARRVPPPPGRQRHPWARMCRARIAPLDRMCVTGVSAIVCARWLPVALRDDVRGTGGAVSALRRPSTCRRPPRFPKTFFNRMDQRLRPRPPTGARASACPRAARAVSGRPRFSLRWQWGARVRHRAGSDEKCRALRGARGLAAINYRHSDFVEVIRELTHGRGAIWCSTSLAAAM